MPKVSILIAVYNAERFLPACLDSLMCQTFADFQAICVDDASTDDSLQMLQQYAARDERIEVIALQENRGQAHARNVALHQARGELICMLDADDWLASNALEKAVEVFDHQTDAVLFDLIYTYEDGRKEPYPMTTFDTMSGDEAFRQSLSWKIHGVYMVRAAIHRRFPYDESCRAYSDDNTTRMHYLHARQVKKSSGRYYYRQHPTSVTHTADVHRFDYLRANEGMRLQMQDLCISDMLLATYENQRWLNLIDVYMFYHVHGSELSAADREYGLQELHRIWATIDKRALQKKTTARFGYRPCKSWRLFRLQEWLYFSLRGLLGRNH